MSAPPEPVDPRSSAALITTPATEIHDLPAVRVSYFEQVPYIQIIEGGHVVLDLSCTAALNLALLLVAEAGQGLNRQLTRTLPQSWPSR